MNSPVALTIFTAPAVIISISSSLFASANAFSVRRHREDELPHTLLSGLTTLLNDELIKTQLLRRALEHAFLNTVLRNEAINVDLLGLADAVGAVHGLQIRLRIPVAVVENNDVCRSKVDTQATCTSGQAEDELLAVRLVVLVDGDNTVLMCSATVNTAIFYGEC